MKKIRVLIVDDSVSARALLRAFLENSRDILVIGEAANGLDAIRMVVALKPDLVTMDLEMPVMGGMEAIAEIMALHPVPILVVSNVADAQRAYVAIETGALDAVSKPACDEQAGAEFVAKVRMLASVPVITHLRANGRKQRSAPAGVAAKHTQPEPPAAADDMALSHSKICAIVSSTGGPQALAAILRTLPPGLPCAVLIVQHIADGFALGMVQWLASVCELPVRLASDGVLPLAGVIYVSPSESNLTLAPDHRIRLLPREHDEIYHPTGDVMLASVAAIYGQHAIGVILTGMGHDGAVGMRALRAAGATTIAQDEASSVIFGMNKVAIDSGAIQQVLPLEQIGPAICRLAGYEG
jgi:two-component system chemotaxis response regulator CheB